MHRRSHPALCRSAALLGLVASLVTVTCVQAAAKNQTTQARHGNLLLALSVGTSGSTVIAHARLTNRGNTAWKYYGGCAPPVLQIQARDANGNHVYGWKPPRVQCFALAVQYLQPHASIQKRARFGAHGTVYVRALVPLQAGKAFQTREIKVILPAAQSSLALDRHPVNSPGLPFP